MLDLLGRIFSCFVSVLEIPHSVFLAIKVFVEKYVFALMGLPLYVIWCFL
jgi:hypothetical protein